MNEGETKSFQGKQKQTSLTKGAYRTSTRRSERKGATSMKAVKV